MWPTRAVLNGKLYKDCYPYGPYESTIFTMRSFYILIPTLAIANMGGANAQLQKSGAENIRSGVIQRAIAITGKRQIHSADFSSGGPSPDGGFVDPLRSNHGRKGTRDAVDEKLLANRGLLSGLTSGFQNIFGLGAGTSLQDTANANAAAGTTTTAGDTSSGSVSGVVNTLDTLSLGVSGAGSGLIDTALGAVGQSGDDASSDDTLSLDVNLPVAGQVGANGSSDDVLSLDVNLPVGAQAGDNNSSGGATLNSTDHVGLALVGVAPAGSGTVTGQEGTAAVVTANPIAQVEQSASEGVAGALNVVGLDTLLLGLSGAGTPAIQSPAPIAPNTANAPPSIVQVHPNQAAPVQVVKSASVFVAARPSASATLSVALSGAASQAIQATARPAATNADTTSAPSSRIQASPNQLAAVNVPASASVSAVARPSASATLSVGIVGAASQTIHATARPAPTTANTLSAPRVQPPAAPPRQSATAQVVSLGSSEVDNQTAQLISAALGSNSSSASTSPNITQSSSVSAKQSPAAQAGGSSSKNVAVTATPNVSGTSSLSASQFSSPNAFPAGVSNLAGNAKAQAAPVSTIAATSSQSSSQAGTTPFRIPGLFADSNGQLAGSITPITAVPDLTGSGSASSSSSSATSAVQGLTNLGQSVGASASPQASGNAVGSGSVSSAVQGLANLGESSGASASPQASSSIAGSGSGSVSAVAQEVANVDETVAATVGAGVQAAANVAAQVGEAAGAAIAELSDLNMSGAASLQSDLSAQLNALD